MSAMHRKCGKGLENGGLVVSFFVFLRFSLFLEGKAGRKSGRETSVASQALNGTYPATQACVFMELKPETPRFMGQLPTLNHISQGWGLYFTRVATESPMRQQSRDERAAEG